MKNLILTLVFTWLATFSFAQEIRNTPPDYKAIKVAINDANSPYFYPKLLTRLKAIDDQLTIEEFRYLYYGYTFQKEYQPYKNSANAKKVSEYLRKQLTKQDVPEAETLANGTLEEDPFNTDAMRLLIRTHALKGDDVTSKKMAKIYQNIMVTVISTGDGITCDTAFHVHSINHEYLIMRILNLSMQKQALIGQCDYLEFHNDMPKPSSNGKQLDGFYFNISRLQDTFSIDQIKQMLEKQ